MAKHRWTALINPDGEDPIDLLDHPTTPFQFFKCLSCMQQEGCPKPDVITIELLKHCTLYCLPIVNDLFHACFS